MLSLSIGVLALLAVLGSLSMLAGNTPRRAFAASRTSAQEQVASLQTGTVIQESNCEQAPPQSIKDRATYTPAELTRYGLPLRTSAEPFAKWAHIVRLAGRRDCTYTRGVGAFSSNTATYNSQEIKNMAWAGKVANEAVPGQNYTETDMDYYVPCVTVAPSDGNNAIMSSWIGLGGTTQGDLVQAGTAATQVWNSHFNAFVSTYSVFVENTGDSTDSEPHYFSGFNLKCGQHIYAKVWNTSSGGCMFVMRLDDGYSTGNQCYGPDGREITAEEIVEFPQYSRATYPDLANFSSQTFLGVGITDNGGYYAMGSLAHDYDQIYSHCTYGGTGNLIGCTGNLMATVGPLENDPGDYPYDEYTVYWHYPN